jgi:Leucine-rich repeat (LRR) protein
MDIYIKYNLEEICQKFNSFDKIPNYDQIVYLGCQNNQLSSLPNLPNSLETLSVSNNQLDNLPNLPNSLKDLQCGNNQLKSLPNLPNSLQYLYCENNQLKSLPNLPNSLQKLWCLDNQLRSLPNLPNSLQYLDSDNNPFLTKKEIKKTNHKYLERNLQLIFYSINSYREYFLGNIFYDLNFKKCSRCQNFFLPKEKYQLNQQFKVPVKNKQCLSCILS